MKKRILSLLLCGLCVTGICSVKANAETNCIGESDSSYRLKIGREQQKKDIRKLIQENFATDCEIVEDCKVIKVDENSFLSNYGLLGNEIYMYVSYMYSDNRYNASREEISRYYYDTSTGHLFRMNQGMIDCLDLEVNVTNKKFALNDTFDISYEEAEEIVSNHLIYCISNNYPDRITYTLKQKDGKYEIACQNENYLHQYKTDRIFYVDKNTGDIYNSLGGKIEYN